MGAPGMKILAMPSTITLSPGARPDSTTHRLPWPVTQSPSTTGLGSATSLPSLSLPVT